jgi:peptide deformylase
MIITDEKALRAKCEPVRADEVDDLRLQLEKELQQSALRGKPGLGLAAPQIGITKRMSVVRLTGGISIDLVNCRIEHGYDEQPFEGEGCLSFPGRFETTMRYSEVHVVDNLVEPNKFIATGLLAIVIQHELDHLDGILLPDVAIDAANRMTMPDLPSNVPVNTGEF